MWILELYRAAVEQMAAAPSGPGVDDATQEELNKLQDTAKVAHSLRTLKSIFSCADWFMAKFTSVLMKQKYSELRYLYTASLKLWM